MLLGRSFLSLEEGSSFKAGENAVILQNPHPAWKPAPSAASNWIGITSNGTDYVPGGDYQYQTTFSMPLNCKTLDVSFAVDDAVKSVAVSDGTKTLQTITSFSFVNGCGGLLGTFTLTDLPATTTLTFTVWNATGPSAFLVQFGACR
jgi:hypothetical protein